jgi:peptide-methionine (R)-S-oxide reductase
MAEGKVEKTEEEWRAELGPERFEVLRGCGTEPPFTGELWDCKVPGTYRCAGCGEGLYSSKAKYESGSGWPSFWAAVDDGAVVTREDRSQGTVRTELSCGRCGGHLGHVFGDGPAPTGQRHCINSASLKLDEDV